MELLLFVNRFLFGRCNNKTVGLFGTCGNSTWRNAYISWFESMGIQYFNPLLTNREYDNVEDPKREAQHLTNDRVIIFPVLGLTDGILSLGEVNIAIAQVIMSWNRHLIVFIEPNANPNFVTDTAKLAKSNQMRSLYLAHLSNIHHPRIHIVESEEAMWEVSGEVLKSL